VATIVVCHYSFKASSYLLNFGDFKKESREFVDSGLHFVGGLEQFRFVPEDIGEVV
jgi:hypothetical protein